MSGNRSLTLIFVALVLVTIYFRVQCRSHGVINSRSFTCQDVYRVLEADWPSKVLTLVWIISVYAHRVRNRGFWNTCLIEDINDRAHVSRIFTNGNSYFPKYNDMVGIIDVYFYVCLSLSCSFLLVVLWVLLFNLLVLCAMQAMQIHRNTQEEYL